MKVHRRLWLLLVLPSISTNTIAIAKVASSSSTFLDDVDEDIATSTIGGLAALRGAGDIRKKIEDLPADVTVPLANLDKPIGELSVKERTVLSETLYTNLEAVLAKLPELDASEIPEIERLIESALEHAKIGKITVLDSIEFVRGAISPLSTTTKRATDGDQQKKTLLAVPAQGGGMHVRLDTDHDTGSTSLEQLLLTQRRRQTEKIPSSSTKKKDGEGKTRRHRRTFSDYQDHHGYGGFPPPKGHLHAKAFDIKDAIFHGDHQFVKKTLQSYAQKHKDRFSSSKTSDHDEKTSPGRRRLSKAEMCTLLAGCASRMSLYDLFIYYYSDDIDRVTGKVDENIVYFDENNLKIKLDRIRDYASRVKDKGETTECDSLLEQFHRTVEYDEVPKWEGATVGQVCLAEGSTVYVQLADAAASSFTKPDLTPALNTLHQQIKGDAQDKWLSPVTGIGTDRWKQISVGADGTVAAINKWNLVFLWNYGTNKMDVKGFSNSYVAVGNADNIWGLDPSNPDNNIRRYNTATGNWDKVVDGQLKQMSVGSDGTVWGVNDSTNIYRLNSAGNGWDRIPGELYHVSVADANTVWGTHPSGEVYRYRGDVQGERWTRITGKLKQVSVGSESSIWGVSGGDNGGVIYRWNAVRNNWDRMPGGLLNQIATGNPSTTWGIDKNQNIFRYTGIEVYFVSIAKSFQILLETFAEEPIACAEELFYHAGPKEDEEFVFGKNGAPTGGDAALYRFPVALDVSTNQRTEHGQIKDISHPAFHFVEYTVLLEDYDKCVAMYRQEVDKVVQASATWDIAEAEELFIEQVDLYILNLTSHCIRDFFEPIGIGLEYVFGEKPSPGFICGIKDAIVDDDKPLPGSCCLDAPYQMDENNWGFAYECSIPCKKTGPYFAGMSTEACDAYGGSWCPAPADCSELKVCIAQEAAWAQAHQRPAYDQYLSSAPGILNAQDAADCGKAREYFGFDENFINDDQVCEDIQQLRFSRDFAFLDEFFGQGSGHNSGGGDALAGEVPPLILTPPDTSGSEMDPVQNGQAWRATNFALTQYLETEEFLIDQIEGHRCPCDAFCISDNICKAIINTVLIVLGVYYFTLKKLLEISVFTYGEVATVSNIAEIELGESMAVLFKNMDATAVYLFERFSAQQVEINALKAKIDYIHAKIDPSVELPPEVDVRVEIVSRNKTRSFLCFTTSRGVETNPDMLELTAFDPASEVDVIVSNLESRELSLGQSLVKIPDIVEGRVFVLKTGLKDASGTMAAGRTVLVSFGSDDSDVPDKGRNAPDQ